MSLQVTGKNIEVGEAFQGFVAEKLVSVLDKYSRQQLAAHVRVEKERGRFRTGCSVRLKSGLVLETSGAGPDAYSSAGVALERLEKLLRRYKRRLKSRHHAAH
jgi:ribosomal subunit interface protein